MRAGSSPSRSRRSPPRSPPARRRARARPSGGATSWRSCARTASSTDPMRVSRRTFLTALAGSVLGALGLGGYGFAVEPALRLRLQRYALDPPGWPPGLKLRIAVLADIHAGMPSDRKSVV